MNARLAHWLRRAARRPLPPSSTNTSLDAAAAESIPADPLTAASAPELTDFNTLLHRLRTIELARMPRAERVLLSVGCSDRSYFDWIDASHGSPPQHWGVELYRPRPDNLPANVRWFTASASSMPEIPAGSVDVIFSGQNIEHLSAADLVGFLLESRRVLRPGGHLAIDSPNRLATSAMHWRHPEHVVEFSPSEAQDLVALAGFDTQSMRGQWLCIDIDGQPLPLLPAADNIPEFMRRITLAGPMPANAFCWWLEATRSDRDVDATTLREHAERLVAKLWPERVNRGSWRSAPATAGVHVATIGTQGMIYRAGPFPVFAGTASIMPTGSGVESIGVRVVDSEDRLIAHGQGEATVETDSTLFGLWAELWADGPLVAEASIAGVRVDASIPDR